jgi:hypothetical protein
MGSQVPTVPTTNRTTTEDIIKDNTTATEVPIVEEDVRQGADTNRGATITTPTTMSKSRGGLSSARVVFLVVICIRFKQLYIIDFVEEMSSALHL